MQVLIKSSEEYEGNIPHYLINCMGNIVTKVDYETLLEKMRIDVLSHPLEDEQFESKSGAFLLS